MQEIAFYRKKFLEFMAAEKRPQTPENLYAPMDYMLHLGGKRLRPVLVLMAAEIFGTAYKKALPAALAIEMFHNFSLIHDDVMDKAPMRRGSATVHEKWGLNTAILSGDAMLVKAYQLFENYDDPIFKKLAQLFTNTAMQVCEGQQHDMDFENRDNVGTDEYLKMIGQKTAVLLGAALKMGAIIAGTSEENAEKIYEFGRLLGLAFQLQDDYLDLFSDPETFGKQRGGDIISNKKTFLYLSSLQSGSDEQVNRLKQLYGPGTSDGTAKIEETERIFRSSGAQDATLRAVEKYTLAANRLLDKMALPEGKKAVLKAFAENLMARTV